MGPDESQRRQLRLALSMNGGVSLAVWIAGAVAEVDEMRRGIGFWGDLLAASGYRREAQVDVMSGASAGGLNAVMLAVAIQTNRPFDEFFPLWLEAADIHRLVKSPNTARAFDHRSVLDGQYFLERLHDALSHAQQSATGTPPTQPLAVFASATLVRANPIAFRDVPGQAIHEKRSDAYFHVARRGPESRGLDGFADQPGTVGNLEALAEIGRATSSLPGLFEPRRFDHATFGSRLVGAFTGSRPSVEIMDGGVIDNVPVARAVRAIYHVPATGHTRRVLLYLHPDPGGDGNDAVEPDPTTAVQVVLAMTGKNSESISADIELLREHNDAVNRRDVQAHLALERFLDGRRLPSEQVKGQVRAVIAAQLLRAAVDPAAELHWHAPGRPRVAPLLDAPNDSIAKDDLAAAFRRVADDNPNVLVGDSLHRTVSALQRVARMAQAEQPRLDLEAMLHELNELQLLCHLITSYQLGVMLEAGAAGAAQAIDALLESSKQLAKFTVADGPPDPIWQGLASWNLPAAEPAGRSLIGELERALERALHVVAPTTGIGIGSRVLRWLQEQPSRTAGAREIGDALLDLRAEPVASDQHINFIRIAGNVDTYASNMFVGDPPAPYLRRYGGRIAGKQLHHLGAFFDRSWRANDLRWGRLDSAPALVEAVLDEDGLTALRADPNLLPAELRDPTAHRDAIRDWLVRQRQEQLLANFAKEETFAAWRTHDRRLVSLLGGRRLTSSAMQGVITAGKVSSEGLPLPVRAALVVLRPLLLALAGIVLAGRWATTAIAWTICVLAATRQAHGQERWWWWYAGALTCFAVVAFVEVKLKPVRSIWRTGPPYLLTAAGIVVGAVFLQNPRWTWQLPAVAAAIACFSLLFWTALPTAVGLSAIVGAWYGWIAFTAAHPHRAAPWPSQWPFHSIWLAWAIGIIVVPIVIGRLPGCLIRPGGSST